MRTPSEDPSQPTQPTQPTEPTESAQPSPLLATPGAVAGSGRDAAVAAHYGDPIREQRLLADGLAAVDLSHRAVLTVTGPDRLSWLHSLTTQQLKDLRPGVSAEALVLGPTGHIEYALHVIDDGQTTWITTEPGDGPGLLAWLSSMRFMLRVEVDEVTDRYAVLGEPVGVPAAPGEPLAWVDPWPGPVGDTAAYGPVEGHPAQGRAWRELVVPRGQLVEAVGDRGLAGTWAADAERVAAWRPRAGNETDHRTIPHEVDWLRSAVHLHKGCYRGQETVARVHNLGQPPRRIAFAHLDGSGHVLPEAGSPILLGERPVGRLTTVARHYLEGPIALAVLKRSVPLDATLTADGVSIATTPIVTPGSGPRRR